MAALHPSTTPGAVPDGDIEAGDHDGGPLGQVDLPLRRHPVDDDGVTAVWAASRQRRLDDVVRIAQRLAVPVTAMALTTSTARPQPAPRSDHPSRTAPPAASRTAATPPTTSPARQSAHPGRRAARPSPLPAGPRSLPARRSAPARSPPQRSRTHARPMDPAIYIPRAGHAPARARQMSAGIAQRFVSARSPTRMDDDRCVEVGHSEFGPSTSTPPSALRAGCPPASIVDRSESDIPGCIAEV